MSSASLVQHQYVPPALGLISFVLVIGLVELLIRVGLINRFIVPCRPRSLRLSPASLSRRMCFSASC